MLPKELYELIKDNLSVSTDTRDLKAGDTFFALKGASFNGNAYAREALSKGAKWVVIDEAKYAIDKHCILVKNVLDTLQKIARIHRDSFSIPVIALTGSNGKTTTKELIAKVLQTKYNTLFTQGNLNNHIGVPLTLLKISRAHEIAVIEMGANHPNEIDFLCHIANPDYGLITNIGKAHLEGFGSFENIIKTKTELYRYIGHKKGVLFVHKDNDLLTTHVPDKQTKTIYYGTRGDVQVKGKLHNANWQLHFSFTSSSDSRFTDVETKIFGDYNFENALAAIGIGHYFGIQDEQMAEAIRNYVPSNNRSQVFHTTKNKLIIDLYNANPSSMQAALKYFIEKSRENHMLILGDMFELGNNAAEEHQKIIDMLHPDDSEVFLVGPIFREICIQQKHPYKTFKNVEALITYFQKNPVEKKEIFIKGSRGIKLEKIVDYL